MHKSNKKLCAILAFLLTLTAVIITFVCTDDKELQQQALKGATDVSQELLHNEINLSEETVNSAEETKEEVSEGQDISTKEEIESTEAEEKELELEPDAQVEQENISYDGTNTGNGQNLLGAYQGLTYYSQADSRWANVMYSSIGDRSQTMKSSACGPTSAAMVVSSSKGSILPTTMASLAVDNGYRTAGNGTAWAYYSFVADYFGFNEYHSTSNFNAMLNYLKTDNDHDGNADYYIIASCGSGLFTTGGHYIVLVADNNGTISVFDPYLYSGKFDIASRRGKASVSGNTVYVSESNFSRYANYKNFWIYSNDKGAGNNYVAGSSYTRYVATESKNLSIRNAPNGDIIGSLLKGTMVTVYGVDGGWSEIGGGRYVSTAYLSSIPPYTSSSKTITGYRTGTYKITSNLHVRTGASTSYKAKTYKQLTANARTQNKRYGNYYYNGYKKGVVCTVTQVKGNWGKTASGWICLSYARKQ